MPVRFLYIITALMIPAVLSGQLTAPGSNTVRYTQYPSSPTVRDPVFVFCGSTGNTTGTLTAVSPGGTGPFTFTWYRWNEVSRGFTQLILTESGVLSSSATNLEEGGYRVSISGPGYNTSLTGWIFIDRPRSTAASA